MSLSHSGQCRCAAIRFEIIGEPEFSFHCQCRDCQKITASAHASQLMVKCGNSKIIGEIRYYSQATDNDNTKTNGFCPSCGTPILTKVHEYPDTLCFFAATLDDPNWFTPEKILYSASKLHWDYTDPNLENG